jgi:phospholipid transport system substrate-binding protein
VVDDLRRNTLDVYATVRSAYAQRRAAQIRNGAPPLADQAYDDIFKEADEADDASSSSTRQGHEATPHRPMGRRRFLLGASLATVATGLAFGPGVAGAPDPTAEVFIERVGQRTVDILKETGLPVPERLARLKGVLDESIDLEYLARVILGRHWRSASEAQRREYLRLFDAIVIQAMAERLGSYAGQGFQIASSRPLDERDTFVATLITRTAADAAPFRVDWRTRKGDDAAFRIIDISVEGVSLVVTQRSEVDEVVNRAGVDGLLAEMRRRLESRTVSKGLPPT